MEISEINDAIVYGDLDASILDRPLELGASHAGATTKPGRWKKWSTSVRSLLTKLSMHETGDKDGPCFLQGSVIGGERKAPSIPFLDLVVLDLDTGEDIDAIRERIQRLGLFGVIYTTHSHLKPVTDVKKDAIVKHLGGGEMNPTLEQVKAYLIDVKRYQPYILEGATLLETEHTVEGVKMFIQHKPMPKFRVIFVLKDRFTIMERQGTQQDAIKEWKERYAGVSKMLGAYFDRSCVDPSRLFFLPRHPKGASEFRVEVIAGKLLDLDTVDRVTQSELRAGGGSAFDQALVTEGQGSNTYKTTGLLKFFAKHGDMFDIETFLLEVDGDGDRGSRPSGPGRTHRCPNDDSHTNAGDDSDVGFFCVNATESDSGKATAHCQHDSCSQMDRIGFTDLICERVGITGSSELMKWVPELADDESEESIQTSDKKPEAFENLSVAKQAIRHLEEGDPEAVNALATSIGMSGFGSVIEDTLIKLLNKKSGVGSRALAKQIKEGKSKATVDGADAMDDDVTAMLEALNKEYALVLLGNKPKIMKKNERGYPPRVIEPATFVLLHAPDKVPLIDAQGNTKLAPLTKTWFDWKGRRLYEEVGFEPGGCGPKVYNTWNGFPIAGRKGDWSLLRQHVFENICLGDQYNFEWLMTWMAQIVQQPGEKLGSAVVLRGRKGTGKSILFDYLRKALGVLALKVSNREHITNQFNNHQHGLLLLVCEEAFWAGDTSSGGILKDMITSNEMLMTPKGVDSVRVSNYMRLALISNEEWVVPAGMEDERRFFVLQCGDDKIQQVEYFASIGDQMINGGGVEAMLYELERWLPVGGDWNVLRKPPVTPWLSDQAQETMHIWDRFFHQLVEDAGCKVPGSPDEVREIQMFEDSENMVPVADLRWYYSRFIGASNAGKHKVGDMKLFNRMVSEWLLAAPELVNSRFPNFALPGSYEEREKCFALPTLKQIRDNLKVKKHLPFSEMIDD